eukprot:gene2276-biopygen1937
MSMLIGRVEQPRRAWAALSPRPCAGGVLSSGFSSMGRQYCAWCCVQLGSGAVRIQRYLHARFPFNSVPSGGQADVLFWSGLVIEGEAPPMWCNVMDSSSRCARSCTYLPGICALLLQLFHNETPAHRPKGSRRGEGAVGGGMAADAVRAVLAAPCVWAVRRRRPELEAHSHPVCICPDRSLSPFPRGGAP